MDWEKAKSILLIVFISLNIFLLANVSYNKLSKGNPKEALVNTQAILKNENIQLECDIPGLSGTMGKIEIHDTPNFSMRNVAEKLLGSKNALPDELRTGQQFSSRGKEFSIENAASFVYRDSNPIGKWNISQKRTLEKDIRKFLNANGINDTGFILDTYEKTSENTVLVSFFFKHEGLNVFSNSISALVSEKGIIELKCSIRRTGALSRDSAKILPAYKVLIINSGKLAGSVITGIDIGYNKEGIVDDDADSSINQKPIWRVKIEGNAPRFFDAVTGVEKDGG